MLLLLACTPVALNANPLSLLTYNVRGLPPSASQDDPDERTTQINKLLGGRRYDVVLLQESFAFAHKFQQSALYTYPGPSGELTLKNWFGVLVAGIPCAFDAYCELPGSSGLISLVYAPGTQPQLLRSTPYNVCHGVFNHSNDCLANKGFVAFTIQWQGNPLHIYNTHLDAGRDLRDRSVRAAQLQQLAAAIAAESNDVNVIVAGDLNLRRSDPEDQQTLNHFLNATGLVSSGIVEQLPHADDFRGVDYILFRPAEQTQIHVLVGGEAAEFRDVQAQPLSDHPPLYARLAFAPLGSRSD